MKEWKESALCQTPPSALCTNCLVKWRNGSTEMAERPMLPWPVSFPCETLCGSELWALGHSTAPDSSPVLSPITCGHRCWAFGTLLESENPNPSVSEPHPSVAQSFAQHQYPWLQQQKKKKKHLREDKLGLPWWFGGYKSTCQCREFHPWPGKWFSQPRDCTRISCLARGLFTTESPRKPCVCYSG